MKQGLKKALAVVLPIVTTAMVLGGCKGTTASVSSDSGSTTDSVGTAAGEETKSGATALGFAWWGNQPRNEATQKAIDIFNQQNPDLTVSTQFFLWDDYWNKMATSAAGKSLPDVIQMDYSYIKQYTDKGQLLDLTPYIENGMLDVSDIDDNILEMGKLNGGIYGIASGVNGPALFYNKTLLDNLGIKLEDNMTLDDFIVIAKKVKAESGYSANLIDLYSLYIDQYTRARDIMIQGQKLGGASAEDYLPYFQLERESVEEGWQLSPDIATAGNSIEQDPMVYGSSPETMSWCKINGSNLLAAYQSAAQEGIEIGMTTVPSENPKKSNYLKPSMLFSISATTRNPEEAVKLLNYLINSSDFYSIMLADRGIPASAKIAAEIQTKLSKEDQTVTDYVNQVVTPNCSPLGAPNEDGYNEQADLLRKIDQKVQYGEMTPQEAAEEYFTKGNEIFEEAAKKAEKSK